MHDDIPIGDNNVLFMTPSYAFITAVQLDVKFPVKKTLLPTGARYLSSSIGRAHDF